LIFVTTGSHTKPFNRLIEELDKLVGERKIKDEVIVNLANATYKPKYIKKWFRFCSRTQWLKYLNKCEIFITHGGTSVIQALKLNKKVIITPRLKELGEHTDDHQLYLALELSKMKAALAVIDMKDLYIAIKKAKRFKPRRVVKRSEIFEIIKNFLKELEKMR
jgi:UDP-N-acetylglucosamine transferase subunit ALG13